MKDTGEDITALLAENERRLAEISAPFDPVTGQGSLGERAEVRISDFAIPLQYIPAEMLRVPLAAKLAEAGSMAAFLRKEMGEEPAPAEITKVSRAFIRLRCKYDFPFWAATLVKIHNKGAGKDVLFRLRRPQRKLVARFEESRKAGKPIRLILLKARQWGGSTTTQLYMAWLQFFHRKGLNSLIIAHQGSGSDEIKDMFDTMIAAYPLEFLHEEGDIYPPDEPKLVGVGKSGSTHRVPQRGCKIKVGTAERPNGCRGGAYSLVHLSEVGLWTKTDGKSPEDIVRSACSGVLYEPYTMIVMESTANGTGNFFHTEYAAAADPLVKSQYEALFIAWYEIEQYSLPFRDGAERRDFAARLWRNRESREVPSAREECGRYLWSLWEKGATLEALHWYVEERSGKNDFAVMASEYPSDDTEAFVHSGAMVFDRYLVRNLEKGCKPPKFTGEVIGAANEGADALKGVQFREDAQGLLKVWSPPEIDDTEKVSGRYLVVVDIGGRSDKADWSVILVLDRIGMLDGSEPPAVAAQWYGHCDMDALAWKAAQVAKWYDDALLVVESNTYETHDRERQLEGGDQSGYILSLVADAYPNLYAREPGKFGFHTNTATKPAVISELIRAVRGALYIERDRRCLDEYDTYERKKNGAYGAIDGKHDDLLMTRAIGLLVCFRHMDAPKIIPRRRNNAIFRRPAISEATI